MLGIWQRGVLSVLCMYACISDVCTLYSLFSVFCSLFCHISDVSVLCRELEAAPSASTAGRILLDQREVVQHHFGELYAQATRNGGISFATDTTTIKRAERASNHYEMRIGGKVRHIRAPVILRAGITHRRRAIYAQRLSHNGRHAQSYENSWADWR